MAFKNVIMALLGLGIVYNLSIAGLMVYRKVGSRILARCVKGTSKNI